MKISISANGKTYQLDENTPLSDFILSIGLKLNTVVVERNLLALTPGEARSTILKNGDSLEIVRIVAGG